MKQTNTISKAINPAVMILTVGVIGGAFQFGTHYLTDIVGADYIQAVAMTLGAIAVTSTHAILEWAYGKLDGRKKFGA